MLFMLLLACWQAVCVTSNGCLAAPTLSSLPSPFAPAAAVAAMPVGEWSPEPVVGGQRALATPGGAVQYAEALTACRQAVSWMAVRFLAL